MRLDFEGICGQVQDMSKHVHSWSKHNSDFKLCKYNEKVVIYASVLPTAYDEAFHQLDVDSYLCHNALLRGSRQIINQKIGLKESEVYEKTLTSRTERRRNMCRERGGGIFLA